MSTFGMGRRYDCIALIYLKSAFKGIVIYHQFHITISFHAFLVSMATSGGWAEMFLV
jgi:hypothetical protein